MLCWPSPHKTCFKIVSEKHLSTIQTCIFPALRAGNVFFFFLGLSFFCGRMKNQSSNSFQRAGRAGINQGGPALLAISSQNLFPNRLWETFQYDPNMYFLPRFARRMCVFFYPGLSTFCSMMTINHNVPFGVWGGQRLIRGVLLCWPSPHKTCFPIVSEKHFSTIQTYIFPRASRGEAFFLLSRAFNFLQ